LLCSTSPQCFIIISETMAFVKRFFDFLFVKKSIYFYVEFVHLVQIGSTIHWKEMAFSVLTFCYAESTMLV